jgi:uncharacterized protein YbjQ (UPF0145 family)
LLTREEYDPGELVIGNSVHSLGFLGSIGAGVRHIMGGEVTQVTETIHEGREQAFQQMVQEAEKNGGAGISGVTSDLRHFHVAANLFIQYPE